jgi:hypothetical protein
VPQISLAPRGLVGALDQVYSGHRFEKLEVRRLRRMPSGDEAVDDTRRSI